MRTDPRAACANAEERLGWAFLHDGLAHPLMALTGYSRWSLRFHDFTSVRAWPRVRPKTGETVTLAGRHGTAAVRAEAPGFYSVGCPFIRSHTVVVKAADAVGALEAADVWFDGLAAEARL